MEQIKTLFEKDYKYSFQKIDNNTCLDLNIDDLFQVFDYTCTPIGQQYLYNLLRNIPYESEIKNHEQWISLYAKNETSRKNIENLLIKLNDSDAGYICSLLYDEHKIASPITIATWKIIQFLPFIFLSLCFILKSSLFFILTVIFFILNLFIHYKNKQNFLLYVRSVPMLLKMITIADKLSNLDEIDNLKFDIKSHLKKNYILKKYLSFFQFDPKLNSDMAILLWFFTELFRSFFLLEPIFFNKLLILLKKNNDSVKKIYKFVGLIDSLQSIYRLRSKYNCCTPEYHENITLQGTSVYHPLVKDCVENTFNMNEKSFIIMGSNMSGKTTFARSIAINILTAHTINTCFADSFKLSKYKIWSSISINDSLTDNQSYYLAEVLRLKHIIDSTSEGINFILLDELFKGTNTIERVASAKATLSYLTNNNMNRIIVPTHDIELSNLSDKQFSVMHFSDNIIDNKLSFSYTLRFGIPHRQNAIKILELYKFPTEIVENAYKYINRS